MGLLLTHKRKLRIWNDMLSLSLPVEGERIGGGKRGEIEIFSRESRYRLFRTLHQLRFEKVTFITLTYGREFPTNPKIYKAHLKEYRRRFEIEFGRVPAVWRLEFQRRGAPHFHIMYLDCPFADIHELCWIWKCVIHSFDMAVELESVDLKLITKGSEAALVAEYLSKYIAKVDERSQDGTNNRFGRWWGRWNLEKENPLEFEIDDRKADLVSNYGRLVGRSSSSWEPRDSTICTIFGGSMGGDNFRDRIVGFLASLEKSRLP